MKWFILNRLMQMVIVLLAVTTIIFVLSRFLADPAVTLLPEDALEEDYIRLKKELGRDRRVWVQYGNYMGALLRGDLGESIRRVGYDVSELIPTPLLNSAKLAGVAWVAAMIVGLTLGITAALNRGSPLDYVARVVAVMGLVTPPWWLGIIAIIIFAVKLQWLPAAVVGDIKHYVLPAGVLAMVALAGLTRLTRASMLEILDSEYVKLARAKGLPYRQVIWKHALRNALIPIVTFAGLYFALLMTGAITIEIVFAWPGLGRLLIDALNSQDYVLVQGAIMVAALIVVSFNTTVDILYGVIDPRIRVS
jgi:peptide/nickel transport system permease protein